MHYLILGYALSFLILGGYALTLWLARRRLARRHDATDTRPALGDRR
jgi:hypothetical protein